MTLSVLILLIIATIFDLKKREIPDMIPVVILIGSWIFAILTHINIPHALLGMALFVGFTLLLGHLRVVAGGDLKLMSVMGVALTISHVLYFNVFSWLAFLTAFFLGWFLIGISSKIFKFELKGFPLAPLFLFAWICHQIFFLKVILIF